MHYWPAIVCVDFHSSLLVSSDLTRPVWGGGDVSWSINKKVWWRSRLLNVAETQPIIQTLWSRCNRVKEVLQLCGSAARLQFDLATFLTCLVQPPPFALCSYDTPGHCEGCVCIEMQNILICSR